MRSRPTWSIPAAVAVAALSIEALLGVVAPRGGTNLWMLGALAALMVGWVLGLLWDREVSIASRSSPPARSVEPGVGVATALSRASDVAAAAEAVVDALVASTGLGRCAVLLYDEGGCCRFVGSRGLSERYQRAVEGHCPWVQGASDAQPIVIDDVRRAADLAAFLPVLEQENVLGLAFVPILARSGVVGKLMLYAARGEAITPAVVRAAHVVAVSLGAAVTRLRMTEALARSELRLRAMINSAMDAVISMDLQGRILDWNPQAERIFGWSASEAIGRLLEELIIPEELRARHREGLAHYRATGEGKVFGVRIEVPALRKDGQRIEVELSIAPLVVEEGMAFSGFLRDISAQKRAAQDLVEARAAAEDANRAKSAFLANMSHEIRTPLTAILGYAELLRDDGDLRNAAAPRLHTIDTIQSAGKHLLTILNDILDISKIEAGRMTVEAIPTDLAAILLEIESLHRQRALGNGVRLRQELATAIPEQIDCDPTRLRQILNLVGNAVKFTQRGEVVVTTRVRRDEEPARLRIEVADTGPGMSAEQAARLFGSFMQADASVTRRYGGTGLGLVISSRLAQLLGGTVTLVRTELGKGSCFALELPLQARADVTWIESFPLAAPVPGASNEAFPALRGRVLLAEDGRDNQYLIAFYLRKAGAEVELADNGRLALEALAKAEAESRPFSLLITDMQMPEMDGYTLVRTLREQGMRLPIVALTAHAMAEDRQRCLEVGCDDYAVKPIDRSTLLCVCSRLLTKRAAA